MKSIFRIIPLFILLVGSEFLQGQTSVGNGPTTTAQNLPSPTPYAITTQDGNSRVWERTTYELDPQGQAVPKKHHVTELASGLNYWSNGQWVESKEEIEVLPQGGAAATKGQHQAYFPGDIYQGAIKVVTPDGQQMQSRPAALSYFDGANTVLIAELTNSTGLLMSPNQVMYPNAFVGVDADLLYTYTKAGFEQDVILRAQPPAPESFGLVSRNTRLQLLTEFFSSPQPNVKSSIAGNLPDQNLDFGVMKMVPGKAFLMGSDSPSVPVGKQWMLYEGRQFLVEEIPIAGVAAELDSLPISAAQVSSRTQFQMASKQLVLPPQRSVQTDTTHLLVAKNLLPTKGFMLDYQTINGSLTNYDFQGDTTYYISGVTYLYGTNTFEGGTILKYARNASLTLYTIPNWRGGICRPVVFTAMDDNSMGDAISGSSGNPSGYYGNPALYFSGVSANIEGMRFLNAQQALEISDNGASGVSDAQFVNCAAGIEPVNDTLALNNALFANVITNFDAIYNSTVNAQNVTFNNSLYLSTLSSGSSGTVTLTNDILSSVTNAYNTNTIVFAAGYNGFYKTTEFGTSASTNTFYPFQTVGGGSYYLTNTDSFLNAGTTNINSTLLNDIQKKTTWPPVRFANQYISTPTNMSPQALRDTNATPNLGYHYDPLDYVFGECQASNITFTAGTAVGWFRTTSGWDHAGEGIYLNSLQKCSFNGTLAAPCYFVRINTVQEQDLTAGYGPGGLTSWANQSGPYANAAIVTAQFLHSTQMAGDDGSFRDDYGILIGNFTDCEFDCTGCGAYVSTYNFTNCLFDRSGMGNIQGVTGNQVFIGNCTFHGGSTSLTPNSSPVTITVQNSSFDGASLSISSYGANSSYASYNYNAYNGSNPFPFGSSNIVLTNFNWQSSWFGNFYLPINSPLIIMGSTNANYLGLYHFTTQTNQVPEGTNIVDIGYHYVATDAYGNPLDSNGDGIPDYLEDANGDGLVDDGETPWSLAILGQPTNEIAYVGDNVTFSVAAQGIGPISYQWQFNGTNILGATSASLVLNVVQTNNAGNYSVTVSNALSSINSSNALLTVYVPSYPVLFSPQTNYVFRGDTTYYIVGNVILYGTNNILEGCAVLKFATNGSAGITVSNGVTLKCMTAPYRPAIFTAKDDNSVGSTINNSTGSPTNYYGDYGLSFGSAIQSGLHNLRMECLNTGIIDNNVTNSIQDVQFANCYYSIGYAGSNSDVILQNVLLQGGSNAVYNFGGGEGSVSCVNGTFHNTFIATNSAYLALTNCLAAGCGFPSFVGTNNVFLTNDIGIFQTVGAGANYLATNSPYRNAGTTNIGSLILADIQTKTTYPPLVYSNVIISTNITLAPQAQRDADTPDLGYHYDPIDYFVDTLGITNAMLTLTNGIVIAIDNNDNGVWLQDGSSITSIGTVTAPNWFVRYSSVQEQPVSLGPLFPGSAYAVNPYHLSTLEPTGVFNFTKFACPAGGGTHLYDDQSSWCYTNLLIQNCEFWSGQNDFSGYNSSTLNLNNNLLARSTTLFNVTSGITNNSLSASNNLFWNDTLTVHPVANSNLWYFFNNDFDSSTIKNGAGGTSYTINGYNAYLNYTNRLNPTNAFDIVSSNSLIYQSGPLGIFYQPTNSSLIYMGSTNANYVGLYHYTVTTNLIGSLEVPEGTNVVSIGYHYVATDTYGNPLDSNGDGIPDYLEDANGNGLVDSGEIGWNIVGDLGLKVIITRPRNGSILP